MPASLGDASSEKYMFQRPDNSGLAMIQRGQQLAEARRQREEADKEKRDEKLLSSLSNDIYIDKSKVHPALREEASQDASNTLHDIIKLSDSKPNGYSNQQRELYESLRERQQARVDLSNNWFEKMKLKQNDIDPDAMGLHQALNGNDKNAIMQYSLPENQDPLGFTKMSPSGYIDIGMRPKGDNGKILDPEEEMKKAVTGTALQWARQREKLENLPAGTYGYETTKTLPATDQEALHISEEYAKKLNVPLYIGVDATGAPKLNPAVLIPSIESIARMKAKDPAMMKALMMNNRSEQMSGRTGEDGLQSSYDPVEHLFQMGLQHRGVNVVDNIKNNPHPDHFNDQKPGADKINSVDIGDAVSIPVRITVMAVDDDGNSVEKLIPTTYTGAYPATFNPKKVDITNSTNTYDPSTGERLKTSSKGIKGETGQLYLIPTSGGKPLPSDYKERKEYADKKVTYEPFNVVSFKEKDANGHLQDRVALVPSNEIKNRMNGVTVDGAPIMDFYNKKRSELNGTTVNKPAVSTAGAGGGNTDAKSKYAKYARK